MINNSPLFDFHLRSTKDAPQLGLLAPDGDSLPPRHVLLGDLVLVLPTRAARGEDAQVDKVADLVLLLARQRGAAGVAKVLVKALVVPRHVGEPERAFRVHRQARRVDAAEGAAVRLFQET